MRSSSTSESRWCERSPGWARTRRGGASSQSGTTPLWLLTHLTRAEVLWIVHRFAGENAELPAGEVLSGDTVDSAIDAYRRTWEQVDAVIAAAPTLDAPCRDVGDEPPVNLRWVLMHLLEETARHAGHADILREVADGSTGR